MPLPLLATLDGVETIAGLREGSEGSQESMTRDALPPPPSQGLEIVFRVGLALLQVNQMELMQLDMEGMSQVGQEGQGVQACPPAGAPGQVEPF